MQQNTTQVGAVLGGRPKPPVAMGTTRGDTTGVHGYGSPRPEGIDSHCTHIRKLLSHVQVIPVLSTEQSLFSKIKTWVTIRKQLRHDRCTGTMITASMHFQWDFPT